VSKSRVILVEEMTAQYTKMRPLLERAGVDVEKWDPFFEISVAKRPMQMVREAHHWIAKIYNDQYRAVITLWKCYPHWDYLFSHNDDFPEVKKLKRLLYALKLAIISRHRPNLFRRGPANA